LLLVILESSETIMYQQGDATSCKGSKWEAGLEDTKPMAFLLMGQR
jgi:hypothetical protein